MKKFFFACLAAVFCFTALKAQDRFFLYGKILGADGTPIPSARISLSTVIGDQPVSGTQPGPDGSFKLVITGRDLLLLKFAAPLADSVTVPVLFTTIQRTLSLTVHLNQHRLSDSNAVHEAASAPIHIKDENTELGIAERLMMAFREEKRLDSAGYILMMGRPMQHRDPDSLVASLSSRIQEETNPMHRELLLLRYLQACTNAKRKGDPAILKMAFNLVEPDSPFWSLAPELLTETAHMPDAAGYMQRVKTRTGDQELKRWIESQH
jgi:hypothetical protein